MEGRGTPDQSQAGPGDPTRDTTLRTSVHTQLADGEQGTPYNTYSPYRAWVDLEAGAAAAQSAGSARSATGAAASAAFSQGRLPVPLERLGAASTAPTNMATPSGSAPEDYSGLGKSIKKEASYLNNHWYTTRKLIGFELGAAPPVQIR